MSPFFLLLYVITFEKTLKLKSHLITGGYGSDIHNSVHTMAKNNLSDDDIGRILQQKNCEENNSDIDDIDFVISDEEENERPEYSEDIEQQLEVQPELNESAIDLPDDKLMHADISVMGTLKVQKKYLLPIQGRD